MSAAEKLPSIDLDQEEERCLLHARLATKQAVMKGMDRETLADAFMIEAMKLTFGIDDHDAARVAQNWKEQTFRSLDADYVTRREDGRPKVVRLLRSLTRHQLMNGTSLVQDLIED